MTKFCTKCGKEMDETALACPNCGAPTNQNQTNMTSQYRIEKREIVTAILLSIFTCGIYVIIWFISLTNDANTVNNENNDTSGVLLFF